MRRKRPARTCSSRLFTRTNLGHLQHERFPETSTQPLRIEVKRPDDFFLDVLDLDPGRVARVCHTALLSYKRYPQTPEDYADMLRKSGVPEFANCLYPILDALSLN